MKLVEPSLTLVARPMVDYEGMIDYLEEVGGTEWSDRVFSNNEWSADAETLVEFAGRLCYKSWKEGLNPNVTKVRKDSAKYLRNIILSGHGSVLEHAQFSFVAHNVSRVFTHEHVRHRVGAAISQESLRYVRLTDISMWFPQWFQDNHPELAEQAKELVNGLEDFQAHLADEFGLDDTDVDFSAKKAKTSFMRRFAPIGLATELMFSMNVRTIRHYIEMRTSEGAEEEIRIIGDLLARLMADECPLLFGDYSPDDHEPGEITPWVPEQRKV